LYEPSLTLAELKNEIKIDLGKLGLDDLPERLERAHKSGCSSVRPLMTLKDCVDANRSGKGENRLEYEEFISRFLTLKKGTTDKPKKKK
jgi:hypothetical protein